jgi:chromate transporter
MSASVDKLHVAPAPRVNEIFTAFALVGLTSFGGGLSARMLHEFVWQRRWIGEDEFFDGLALSQALPGVNVANLAIWIGFRLRGWRGAAAGLAGIVLPTAMLIVLFAALLTTLGRYPVTHVALAGAAAVAIGLSLSMAITAMKQLRRSVFRYGMTLATFVAVALLKWPVVWVVLFAGTVSVAVEYWRAGEALPGTGR